MSAAAVRPCDVLCTGLIVADHVAAPIPAMPPSGGLVATPRTELTIGGCGANVAVDLVKLGVSANIVGCVGDDVLGRYIREELVAAGVGCEGIVFSSTSQTAVTLVVNVEGEDRRFIHAAGANTELTGKAITEQMIAASKVIYVGGMGMNPALSGANVAKLFKQARLHGVKTVLDIVVSDPGVMRGMLESALAETDVFLPNTDEARMITGRDDPGLQAMEFCELGAKTVIVTCGANGSIVRGWGHDGFRCAAHDVAQVDGTGGGDAFASGFILGMLENRDLETCVIWGTGMGASCVQSPGATTGTFTRDQLRDFIDAHPLTIEQG